MSKFLGATGCFRRHRLSGIQPAKAAETRCAKQAKLAKKQPLDTTTYGRKESEGKDFNEDTNFGKLKRIPYQPLQEFLAKHRLTGRAAKKPKKLSKVLKEMKKIGDEQQEALG
jgi:hypothetical protein